MFIIKVGNKYVAGKNDYKIVKGYLDREHPSTTISLTKFDFDALEFEKELDAIKFASNFGFCYQVVHASKNKMYPDINPDQLFHTEFRRYVKNCGMDRVMKELKIRKSTFDTVFNDRYQELSIQTVIRVTRTMIRKGYRGATPLYRRSSQEYYKTLKK